MKTNESARKLFQEQLGYYMQQRNVTQKEIADALGVSTATASDWASGKKYPRVDAMQALADFLEVSMSELVSPAERGSIPKNLSFMPKMKTVPLLGDIACGTPILAQENIEDEIPLPDYIRADFCLTCKGDSMIGIHIHDGDIVFLRKQDDVDSGQIAAVLIGEEATLKRVIKHPGGLVELRAENPDFPSMYLNGDEDVRIIGKALHYLAHVR